MSYILDALRKADAQRERDPARGIHAQAIQTASVSPARRGGFSLPFWIAGAAGAAVLVWAGWFLFHDREPASAPARLVAAAPTPQPAPQPTAQPAPAPAAAAPVVQPPPPPAAAPVVTAPVRAPDPTNTSQPNPRGPHMPPTRRPGGVPGLENPMPPTAAAPAMSPSMPASVAQPVPNPTVTGLPPDAPKLTMSGGVYSASPAQRMLIVNGQVFNEGSEIAPGVTLEEIKARTAVLRFRGARYSVAY
jgi:general secretion pathway protein B